jgi:hypothetical protein
MRGRIIQATSPTEKHREERQVGRGSWGGANAELAGCFVLRRCEDASLRCPCFAIHEELSDYDSYDTVEAR